MPRTFPTSSFTVDVHPNTFGMIGTRGATYVDGDVVVDGLLVTECGYQQNTHVLKAFLEMLDSQAG